LTFFQPIKSLHFEANWPPFWCFFW
jgi:hypothetical protein